MRVPLTPLELSGSESESSSENGEIIDANKPQTSDVFDTSPVGSVTTAVASRMPAFGTSSSPTVGGSSSSNVDSSGPSTQPAFGVSSTPATTTPAFRISSTSFGVSSTSTASKPAFNFSSTPNSGSTTSPSLSFPTLGDSFHSTQSVFRNLVNTPPVVTPASTTSPFGFLPPPVNGTTSSFSGFGPSPLFSESTSPFGPNSSYFGPHSPLSGWPGNGVRNRCSCSQQSSFEGFAPFASSHTPGFGNPSQCSEKLESISAMPESQGKCHEELRWEIYQSRDKGTPSGPPTFSKITADPFSSSTFTKPYSMPLFGYPYRPTPPSVFGPSPSTVSPTSGFNTYNKQESKPFSYAPAFNQVSANPFSSTAPSNLSAPKTSTLCTSTVSSSPISSSSAPSPTQSVVESTPGFVPPFNSTASLVSSFGVPFVSTPALSSSIFGKPQPATSFQSTTPSLGQTSSLFGQPNPPFWQSNSSFSLSSAFERNMLSNNPPLQRTSSFIDNHTTSSPSVPSQPAQSAGGTSSSVFGPNNVGQSPQPTQNQGVLVFLPIAGGISSIFGQNLFGQVSTNQGPSLAQPTSNINPFETPGPMHQTSVGHVGAAPLIQYGTYSLPVVVGAVAVANGSPLLIMDMQNFVNLKI